MRYDVRGLVVLSACTVLTIGIAAAGIATAASTGAAQHLSLILLATPALACIAVTAVSAGATWSAGRRVAALPCAPVTATGREALIDLLAMAHDSWVYATGGLPFGSSVRSMVACRRAPGGLRLVASVRPARSPMALRQVDRRSCRRSDSAPEPCHSHADWPAARVPTQATRRQRARADGDRSSARPHRLRRPRTVPRSTLESSAPQTAPTRAVHGSLKPPGDQPRERVGTDRAARPRDLPAPAIGLRIRRGASG